ncbi:hypothetical protein LCGC14_2911100, partial [marine sediment metagenome]
MVLGLPALGSVVSDFTRRFETPFQKTRRRLLDEARARLQDIQRTLQPVTDVAGPITERLGGLDIKSLLSRLEGIPSTPSGLAALAARRAAPTPAGESVRFAGEEFETRIARPFGAAGLQIAESPAGGGLLGVTELKGVQRQLEALGVPEDISPLPRERTFEEALEGGFVDPFKAAIGDEKEQAKSVAVLEEAGWLRAMAAMVIFDPSNLLPGLGFTKLDDFLRLLGIARRGGKGAQAA